MDSIRLLVYVACFTCFFIQCSTNKAVIQDEVQRSETTNILLGYGLNGLKVNYDFINMESIENDGMYSYLEALDLAIESFLTDDTHEGSPLAIISIGILSYKGNQSKQQQHLDKLLILINSGGSLCMPDIEEQTAACAHAEEGENVEQNWIFLLEIPELSDNKFWAIVPKKGKEPVYNYGFD